MVISKSGRPGLGLLSRASQCVTVEAVKHLVDRSCDAGCEVVIRPSRKTPTLESFRGIELEPVLSFGVSTPAGKTLKEATKLAAGAANRLGFRAGRERRIGIRVAFDAETLRNVLSSDTLEEVLDGLGASAVGSLTFFDPPAKARSEYCNDDSVIFWLTCARVHDFPPGIVAWVDVYDRPGRST